MITDIALWWIGAQLCAPAWYYTLVGVKTGIDILVFLVRTFKKLKDK